MIKMILACDQANSIGWLDGSLPWHIEPDMRRFKDLTLGHTVVMGRSTYDSLKRPNGLPNRKNIVLTRQPYSEIRGKIGENIDIISSLDYLTQITNQNGMILPRFGLQDCWIIGGAQVYGQAIEKRIVDEIYLTQVHTISGADVVLPFDLFAWKRFVLTQRAVGVNWDVDSIETPYQSSLPPNCPQFSYIHFTRLK